ncbi:REF/SRPP-like protein OsI_017815 [Phragmites australis]|uniref:REF/SRPP-like protein OsI_017815 n=1 Tax=Phragmites australis TaxID=29695 RepID=UPI002D7A1168|nr:REF/SRPP-like protein OsI_017815 [Phragmites australis]
MAAESANDARNNQPATEEEVTVERATEEKEERLRYLEFVQQAAAQALVLAAAVYAYAKQGAGPLGPGVDSVEGTVKAVVGPVYDRFHAVPLDLLKFLDRKVGESVEELDRRVPPVVKEAPNLALSAVNEVRQSGVVGTAAGLAKSAIARAEPKARELYTRYEPVAERRAAEAWVALNRLPLVPSVTRAVLPTAAQLSARYNSAVCDGAKRGSTVATYLPLVPTERLARVFSYPMADAAPAPEMQPIPSQ